jgi:hypothetical protein
MAYISSSKMVLEWDFQKRKYLMGPISQKGNLVDPQWIFDGLHKRLRIDFGIKLLKKEIFDGTHITKKEI